MNNERVNMPDIDIDFCMNPRGTAVYGRLCIGEKLTFPDCGIDAARIPHSRSICTRFG